MKTFNVSATVTISLYAEIEASNKKEALKKAQELAMPSLCHQCAGRQGDDEWSNSGEFDGEAQNIQVDE